MNWFFHGKIEVTFHLVICCIVAMIFFLVGTVVGETTAKGKAAARIAAANNPFDGPMNVVYRIDMVYMLDGKQMTVVTGNRLYESESYCTVIQGQVFVENELRLPKALRVQSVCVPVIAGK